MRTPSLALLAALLAACGTADDTSSTTSTTTGTAPHDAGADVDEVVLDGSAPEIQSLKLTPSPAELVVVDGAPLSLAFTAKGVTSDGTLVDAAVEWGLSATTLGTIDAGVFTANGALGGKVTVTAKQGTLTASAELTVRLVRHQVDPAVTAGAVTAIDAAAAGTAAAPGLDYPYDRTVMPQNVQAPLVQMSGYGDGIYRVRMVKPHVTVVGYVPAGRFQPDAALWRALADSDTDQPLTVTVDHWDQAQAALSAPKTITLDLSPGAISGTVYYWNVQGGTIQRIDPAVGQAQPMAAKAACMACHSVSRDGRYLAADYGNELLGSVLDLTAAGTPEVFAPSSSRLTTFSTFSPDSKRLLANVATPDPSTGSWTDNRQLGLFDVATGNPVAASGLPSNVAQPEWSPDGKSVALLGNLAAFQYPLASFVFEQGDLMILPVTGPDAFGPLSLLHQGSSLAGAPEQGSADAHPSWSPDSALLAFAHGSGGRASVQTGGGADWTFFPGALYLVPAAGGAAVRLDNANGGATAVHSYWPTFSPFTTLTLDGKGQYYWLAYFSHRPYAGQTTGQLWVTAIDAHPKPGQDPSHPPYWLPGQDPSSHNAAAYWTAQPCRQNGSGCTSASECCSATCQPATPGAPATCTPPAQLCRALGETCGGAGDCCQGVDCVGNTCVPSSQPIQ